MSSRLRASLDVSVPVPTRVVGTLFNLLFRDFSDHCRIDGGGGLRPSAVLHHEPQFPHWGEN